MPCTPRTEIGRGWEDERRSGLVYGEKEVADELASRREAWRDVEVEAAEARDEMLKTARFSRSSDCS